MGEIIIYCAECGSQLEEADNLYELKWGCYCIKVSPCPNCMEELAQGG